MDLPAHVVQGPAKRLQRGSSQELFLQPPCEGYTLVLEGEAVETDLRTHYVAFRGCREHVCLEHRTWFLPRSVGSVMSVNSCRAHVPTGDVLHSISARVQCAPPGWF